MRTRTSSLPPLRGGDGWWFSAAAGMLAAWGAFGQTNAPSPAQLTASTNLTPSAVRSVESRAPAARTGSGTTDTNRSDPRLLAIKLGSDWRVLRKGETAQLAFAAAFSDGSERDITSLALYSSSAPRIVTVDRAGRVQATGHGEAVILASCLRKTAIVRVLVPQPLPFPFPEIPAHNRIDELVYAKLSTLGFPPSDLCTDAEFLRRVYLDTIGLLPTPAEARQFLADSDPAKRRKLIERLLQRDEFADFRALKWGDLLRIKSDYPVGLGPKAAQAYHRWLRTSLAENKPGDQFARELITATGSSFRDGPANFLRAMPKRDAQSMAESAALVFMGARVGCARCHSHPSESWGPEDYLGLAAFFAKVAFKPGSEPKEEIVYRNPKGVLRHPQSRQAVKPKLPGGSTIETGPEEDPRARFGAWLTSAGNPWFARNQANRVWSWLFGRGIVHEPDDQRPTNPPSNPELLDYLARELVSHKHDLLHLYRIILNSRTYQLSSAPNAWNSPDTAHFSHYFMKRMGAEQLLDAISQVTETSEAFSSQSSEPSLRLPVGHRATQLGDGSMGSAFFDLFGRPSRDRGFEGERSGELSLYQALYFASSDQLEGKIATSPRLKRLLKANKTDSEIIEELYLAAFARLPTPAEKAQAAEHLARNKADRPQALGDVMWAVLNTKEFLFVR